MEEIKATKSNLKKVIRSLYLDTSRKRSGDDMIDEILELFYKNSVSDDQFSQKEITLPVDKDKLNRFANVEKYRFEILKTIMHLTILNAETNKIVKEYKLLPSTRTKKHYLGKVEVGNVAAEPIRSIEKIREIENTLRSEENWRNLALFVLGINLGRRIGDLLKLKVKDVSYKDGTIKEHFTIIEEKTNKKMTVKINEKAKKVIQLLFDEVGLNLKRDSYLIYNTRKPGWGSICTGTAWKALKKIFNRFGLKGNYSSHSLRKTLCHHLWKNGTPIEVIQKMNNHASVETTMDYLGITSTMVSDSFDQLDNIY